MERYTLMEYPQAWFRTSCDIDILIHQEDVERTIELLVKNGYEHQSDATTHDYSFITPGKVHLELHYSLNQGERMEAINAILDMVWVCSSPFKESPYCFQMSNDMFVFYRLALYFILNRHKFKERCSIIKQNSSLFLAYSLF